VAGDVLLQGRLQAPDGTKLGLGRRLTNQGVLQVGGAAAVGVGSPGGVSELHFMEDTLIDGTGRIELSERATAFNRFTGYSGVIGRTPVLTLGAGQTLTGAGILGGANTSARTLDIVNQGTILVEGVNGLQLAAATSNTGFTNQGTLTVRSLLQVTGGATNRGLMVVEAGAQAFGTLNQADGTLTVDGTADAVRLSGGLLNGTGTVSSLLQSGGSFLPGHSPGSFTIDGNYTLNGGDLVLEIDGDDPAQQDHLFINGNASFRGGRVVIDLTGYQGSGAASFAGLLNVAGTLSLAHPVSGTSASFVVAGLDSGRSAQLAWSGGQLSLNLGLAAAVPEPGTWATLLAGLAAIGLRLARRRVAA
jgi:PEP-CTERM motif